MSNHYTAHEAHQAGGHFLVTPVTHHVSSILVVPVALVVVVALANWCALFREKPDTPPSLPMTMPQINLREHGNRILALFWRMIEKLEQPAHKPEPSPFWEGIEKIERYGRIAFFVGVGIVALFFLASVAFTPAGMQVFLAGLVANIRWLSGSPEGNRVAAFAALALAVIGIYAFIRSSIIKNFGSAPFGWGQVAIGILLVCVAGYGWHLSQIHLFPAIGMVVAGLVLMSKGSDNIANNQGVAAPRAPELRAKLPRSVVFGDARDATDDEIDAALRGVTPTTTGGYPFKD